MAGGPIQPQLRDARKFHPAAGRHRGGKSERSAAQAAAAGWCAGKRFVHDSLNGASTPPALRAAAKTTIDLAGGARRIRVRDRAAHIMVGQDVAGTDDHGRAGRQVFFHSVYAFCSPGFNDAQKKNASLSVSKLLNDKGFSRQASKARRMNFRIPVQRPVRPRRRRRLDQWTGGRLAGDWTLVSAPWVVFWERLAAISASALARSAGVSCLVSRGGGRS